MQKAKCASPGGYTSKGLDVGAIASELAHYKVISHSCFPLRGSWGCPLSFHGQIKELGELSTELRVKTFGKSARLCGEPLTSVFPEMV